jgi:hypothetical protein
MPLIEPPSSKCPYVKTAMTTFYTMLLELLCSYIQPNPQQEPSSSSKCPCPKTAMSTFYTMLLELRADSQPQQEPSSSSKSSCPKTTMTTTFCTMLLELPTPATPPNDERTQLSSMPQGTTHHDARTHTHRCKYTCHQAAVSAPTPRRQ